MTGRALFACTGCGRTLEYRGRCETCGPAKPRTTAGRGYGAKHRKVRSELLMDAVGRRCPLCGEVMAIEDGMDLDHTVPASLGGVGDRIVHASCNRRRGDGGVR